MTAADNCQKVIMDSGQMAGNPSFDDHSSELLDNNSKINDCDGAEADALLGYEAVVRSMTIVYMLTMIAMSNIMAHILRCFYRQIFPILIF
jgi:hypothetical protein